MTIKQLIKKYTADRDYYLTSKYNETLLRSDFLDPFFELLGWDIKNNAGKPTNEREVILEEALGLLMTVPEEVSSCFNKIQEKCIEAYKAYQNQKCSKQIQEAKTMLAANNYNGTLEILSQIDPSASCFKEAETMMKNAEAKIDTEEKKQWDLKMKVYNDNVALEKQRINAVKDIAVAYYKSKPTTVNYSYIIK